VRWEILAIHPTTKSSERGGMGRRSDELYCAGQVMHLVREACAHHRTHKFTHVQPIWFKNPTGEFPDLIEFVQQQAGEFFTHPGGLRSLDGLSNIHHDVCPATRKTC